MQSFAYLYYLKIGDCLLHDAMAIRVMTKLSSDINNIIMIVGWLVIKLNVA